MCSIHSIIVSSPPLTDNISCYDSSTFHSHLSKMLMTEGVESNRQLHNLEKSERLAQGDDDSSSGSMSEEELL